MKLEIINENSVVLRGRNKNVAQISFKSNYGTVGLFDMNWPVIRLTNSQVADLFDKEACNKAKGRVQKIKMAKIAITFDQSTKLIKQRTNLELNPFLPANKNINLISLNTVKEINILNITFNWIQ